MTSDGWMKPFDSKEFATICVPSPSEVAAPRDLSREDCRRIHREGLLIGRPVLVEHQGALHVGKVHRSSLHAGDTSLVAHFRLHTDNDDYEIKSHLARWTHKQLDEGRIMFCSLGHLVSRGEPVEVSLVTYLPKRPGASVLPSHFDDVARYSALFDAVSTPQRILVPVAFRNCGSAQKTQTGFEYLLNEKQCAMEIAQFSVLPSATTEPTPAAPALDAYISVVPLKMVYPGQQMSTPALPSAPAVAAATTAAASAALPAAATTSTTTTTPAITTSGGDNKPASNSSMDIGETATNTNTNTGQKHRNSNTENMDVDVYTRSAATKIARTGTDANSDASSSGQVSSRVQSGAVPSSDRADGFATSTEHQRVLQEMARKIDELTRAAADQTDMRRRQEERDRAQQQQQQQQTQQQTQTQQKPAPDVPRLLAAQKLLTQLERDMERVRPMNQRLYDQEKQRLRGFEEELRQQVVPTVTPSIELYSALMDLACPQPSAAAAAGNASAAGVPKPNNNEERQATTEELLARLGQRGVFPDLSLASGLSFGNNNERKGQQQKQQQQQQQQQTNNNNNTGLALPSKRSYANTADGDMEYASALSDALGVAVGGGSGYNNNNANAVEEAQTRAARAVGTLSEEDSITFMSAALATVPKELSQMAAMDYRGEPKDWKATNLMHGFISGFRPKYKPPQFDSFHVPKDTTANLMQQMGGRMGGGGMNRGGARAYDIRGMV